MVKVQNSKDKDKTSLLQGSVQFSLIRQSCHWNHWQLCLSKKGQIGISVLLVCNLTTCRTWQERTTKGSTKSFSVLKATASLFSGIEINNYFGVFFFVDHVPFSLALVPLYIYEDPVWFAIYCNSAKIPLPYLYTSPTQCHAHFFTDELSHVSNSPITA